MTIQCQGKVRYHSKRIAKKAARRVVGMGLSRNAKRLCVYPCPHCLGYHLGHKTPPKGGFA